MTRVLVIGEGPPPPESRPALATSHYQESRFPTLRLWQGLRALVQGGVKPVVFSSHAGGGNAWTTIHLQGCAIPFFAAEVGQMLPALIPEFLSQYDIQAVITLGPFLPLALAGFIPPEYPLFIDIPGDPMAEAQLRAEDGIHHLKLYRSMLTAALLKGDCFSVCSPPQRHALLGQLGLMGRLLPGEDWQSRVVIIPPGMDPSWLPAARGNNEDGEGKGQPDGQSTSQKTGPKKPWITLFGSANHWMAVDDTIRALDIVLQKCPEARVKVVGGLVPGFADSVFARFQKAIHQKGHSDRVDFLGWLSPEALLEVLDQSRVCLSLDRPCLEGELGARTRYLLGVARGVPWVLTAQCHDAHHLMHLGLARGVAPGDFQGAGAALVEALQTKSPPLAQREAFIQARSRADLMAPLVDFAQTPQKMASGLGGIEGALIAEKMAAQRALEEIHQTPTWRILGGLHKILKKVSKGD